jgi:hypothetical protein
MDRRTLKEEAAMIWIAATAILLGAGESGGFIRQYCVSCHGRAGGVTLTTFDEEHPERKAETAEKVIRKIRAGMMPPPGSPRADRDASRLFVERLERKIDASASRLQPKPQLQRLNRAEYSQAVRDLLDVNLEIDSLLPPDTVSAGFDNIADAQRVSPAVIGGYLRAAGVASKRAASRIRKPSPRAVEDIARRAFRGTATAEDIADAVRFYKQGGGGRDGMELALRCILMNPRFLFRIELLEPEGVASRLSFFLWGTGPDDTLLQAVRRGDALELQVRRMLKDHRSQSLATRFAAQWLRLGDLEKAAPDPQLFPGFSPDLAASMRRETESFFRHLIREDRDVTELITADYSFIDSKLASHYKISGIQGGDMRRVMMPPERRGVMGQGSMLVSTSLAERTSPVLRGKWVLEVLLGLTPPPPPPNVPSLDDRTKPEDRFKQTTRQRLAEHTQNPRCSGCHRFIDPLGIALENFAADGSFRDLEHGLPVDANGKFHDGTPMQGSAGVRDVLLQYRELMLRNFTSQLLTYATGRRMTYADQPAIRAIVAKASAEGNRFSAYIQAIAASPIFKGAT